MTSLVLLGDSITLGVRNGVDPGEEWAALVLEALLADWPDLELWNLGRPNETSRTGKAKLNHVAGWADRPAAVAIMYGTCDSFHYPGTPGAKISLPSFAINLRAMANVAQHAGIVPVLMAPPRWAPGGLDSYGANPNVALGPYVAAARDVARDEGALFVNHWGDWGVQQAAGQDLGEWTLADGCHPNPSGHARMASLVLPALRLALAGP